MRYKETYESVLLGDALIVYSRKLEMNIRNKKDEFKIELMKLDMFGKMITGEELKLLESFNDKENLGDKPKKNSDKSLIRSGFEII